MDNLFSIKKRNKKGLAGGSVVIGVLLLVVTIAIVGILLLFIFSVFNNMALTSPLGGTPLTGNVTNETSSINSTGTFLKLSATPGFSPTIVTVINVTGTVIASPNWTITSAGYLTNASAQLWHVVNVTYTYTYLPSSGSAVIAFTANGSNAIGTTASYLTTVILIGILILIIGLVSVILFMIFRFSGGSPGNGSLSNGVIGGGRNVPPSI
jgi:hypothetical protein